EAGDLVASEQALRRLLSLKAREPTDWHAYWAQLGLGDIAMHRGSLDLALEIYWGASTPSTASPRRIPQAQDGSAICPSREKRSAMCSSNKAITPKHSRASKWASPSETVSAKPTLQTPDGNAISR